MIIQESKPESTIANQCIYEQLKPVINLWFPLVLGLFVVLVVSISLCASLLPTATSSQRPLQQQQITCELLLLTLNFISTTSTENPPLNCCI
jgi:hypothetical protein